MLKASDEPNSKSCANYGGVLPKRRRYWWKIKVNLRSDRFYLKQIALDMPMPEVGHIRYHLLWLARNIRWHLALLRAEASAAAGRVKPVAEETGGRLSIDKAILQHGLAKRCGQKLQIRGGASERLPAHLY